MSSNKVLKDAINAPSKVSLETHREAIQVLRGKGYTWREISEFLAERGIDADHTKIYRFMNGAKNKSRPRRVNMTVASAEQYKKALGEVPISETQWKMLKAHFEAPNRSITYTKLAESAGYSEHAVANSQYGKLGRAIGEAVSFKFAESDDRPGEKFYGSAIGMPNPYTTGEFQLVMHHELAKAIRDLGFPKV